MEKIPKISKKYRKYHYLASSRGGAMKQNTEK